VRFEVTTDRGGRARWALHADNGQNVASSGESFASTSSGQRATQNLKERAATTYEVCADAGGKHRWRAKSSNGQTIAGSGDSFASQSNAQRAADNVRDNAASATRP